MACGWGRAPTGVCIGWHRLTEEQYLENKKKYEELTEEEKKTVFHARAVDGLGE